MVLLTPGERGFARRGIIQELHLVHFMCHGNLSIQLGRNVNFVHGLNGSGKSAILISICACFGMKASETRRASSLKELIQHGKNRAEISVTILNESADAFRPQIYGNRIRIQRIITRRDGASRFKIFGADGQLVGSTKAEMEQIRDHFNIRVDNPCVVLNQESAREFLQANSSSSQYAYFLRATQLEQMEQDILKHELALGQMQEDNEAQALALEKAQEEYERVSEELRGYKELENIDGKIAEARVNLVWAAVSQTLKELDKIVGRVKEKEGEIEGCDKMLGERKEESERILEKRVEVQGELDAVKQACEEKVECLEVNKAEMGRLSKDLRDLAGEIKKKTRELKMHQKKERKLMLDMKKAAETDVNAELERQRAELSSDLKGLESSLDLANEEVNAAEVSRAQFGKEEEAVEMQKKEADQMLSETQRKLSTVIGRIQNIDKSYGNRFALFGSNVDVIHRDIARKCKAGAFSVAPLGPLGGYITIKESDWSSTMEAILYPVLSAYVVDNHQDKKVLENILQSATGPGSRIPMIIIQKKSTQQYSLKKPTAYLNQLANQVFLRQASEQLVVSDPWAFNIIVDKVRPEHVLLCSNEQVAADVFKKINRESPASSEFISCLFTQDGVCLKSAMGSVSADPRYESRKLLTADQKSVREEQVAEKSLLEEQLLEQKACAEEYAEDYASAKKHAKQLDDQLKVLRKRVSNLGDKLGHKKYELAELDLKRSDSRADLSFRVELEQVQQEVADAEASLEETCQERKDIKATLVGLKEENDELAKSAQVDSRLLEKAEMQFKEQMELYEEKSVEIQEIQRELSHLTQELLVLKEKEENLSRNHANYERQALQVSGEKRVVEEGVEHWREEYGRLKKRKEREEEKLNGKSYEEVYKESCEKNVKVLQLKTNLIASETSFEALKQSVKDRGVEWRRYRRKLEIAVNQEFYYSLESQGYSGALIFDHKEKTLQIEFDRRGNNEASSKDTKTLSGGERSFSTLCFIVAIGHAILTPFVAFDEFDIFMDSVNRRVSTNLLLKLAQRKSTRQFIFITPHDISHIEPSDSVHIYQLHPPREGVQQ